MATIGATLTDTLAGTADTGISWAWPGGLGTLAAYGTFDSGTVQFSASFDNGTTFVSLGTDAAFTANGLINFDLPPCLIRGVLSGATAASLTIAALARDRRL